MAELTFSGDAIADIENIAAFSRERFGLVVAKDYIAGLETSIDRLCDHP